jgi:hypothetical protein
MQEKATWYLIVSSLFVIPLFWVAAYQWWKENTGTHSSQESATKFGILLPVLSLLPIVVFLLFVSFYPSDNHVTLQNACRWSGEALALVAIASTMLCRGWMRLVLAAFSGWSLAVSFILLHPDAFR